MELFEEIRREYEFGVGTIAGVAPPDGSGSDWQCAAEGEEED